MATILSSNIIQFISPVIIFIFIFTIFFAVLSKVKIFSENKPLNSLIALCMAVLFLLVPEARQIIEIATPWFILFVIAGMLLVMCFLVLGIEPSFIKSMAEDNAAVIGVVIGGVIFIFLLAATKVFGPGILQYPASADISFFGTIRRTVLNPKILGFLIVMIIAGEVVRRVGFPPVNQGK